MKIWRIIFPVMICFSLAAQYHLEDDYVPRYRIEKSETVSGALKTFGWHSCAVLGVTIIGAAAVAAIFYGFDRMISDGKYTRNVIREVTKVIISRLDKNGIVLKTILMNVQKLDDEHEQLMLGQRKILFSILERKKGLMNGKKEAS